MRGECQLAQLTCACATWLVQGQELAGTQGEGIVQPEADADARASVGQHTDTAADTSDDASDDHEGTASDNGPSPVQQVVVSTAAPLRRPHSAHGTSATVPSGQATEPSAHQAATTRRPMRRPQSARRAQPPRAHRQGHVIVGGDAFAKPRSPVRVVAARPQSAAPAVTGRVIRRPQTAGRTRAEEVAQAKVEQDSLRPRGAGPWKTGAAPHPSLTSGWERGVLTRQGKPLPSPPPQAEPGAATGAPAVGAASVRVPPPLTTYHRVVQAADGEGQNLPASEVRRRMQASHLAHTDGMAKRWRAPPGKEGQASSNGHTVGRVGDASTTASGATQNKGATRTATAAPAHARARPPLPGRRAPKRRLSRKERAERAKIRSQVFGSRLTMGADGMLRLSRGKPGSSPSPPTPRSPRPRSSAARRRPQGRARVRQRPASAAVGRRVTRRRPTRPTSRASVVRRAHRGAAGRPSTAPLGRRAPSPLHRRRHGDMHDGIDGAASPTTMALRQALAVASELDLDLGPHHHQTLSIQSQLSEEGTGTAAGFGTLAVHHDDHRAWPSHQRRPRRATNTRRVTRPSSAQVVRGHRRRPSRPRPPRRASMDSGGSSGGSVSTPVEPRISTDGLYPHQQQHQQRRPVSATRPTPGPSQRAASARRRRPDDEPLRSAGHREGLGGHEAGGVRHTSLQDLCRQLGRRLSMWVHSGTDASQLDVASSSLEAAALEYRYVCSLGGHPSM